MSKGRLVGSARGGFSNVGIPVAVAADYGIVSGFINGNAAVSVGGELGIFTGRTDERGTFVDFSLSARGNFHYEFVENLDKQYTTQELATLLNERRMDTTDWDNFLNRTDAEKWLLTDCKIAQQANGISQVTLRWIGGTKIEEKLYPTKS
jgi:hypothetical protein